MERTPRRCKRGEKEMAAAGRRRVLSDAAREHRNRRRRELRQQRKLEREEERRRSHQEAEEDAATSDGELPSPPSPAATLLPILASAAASSLRFLDEHGHLLLPSQSLSFESALSELHSLLLSPPFPRAPPAPADGHGYSGGSYWFLRFLASAASDGADPRWVEAFRMSRSSFYLLLQTLAPSLSFHSSMATMGATPPPDHKLGAALFRLSHAAPFRAVARRFGMDGGAAAACRAFYEVCRSVTDRLGHLFELPSDVKRVVEGFRWEASLPNCGGVLGFALFPVSDDDGEGDGGAVVAQVVVDSEGRFLDVSAGWPGSMSPAQILQRTKLFSSPTVRAPPGSASGHGEDADPGLSPPRYLLGGSCCPLLPWLLTPFPESDTGEEDHPSRRVFNEVHAQGMRLAAKAVEAIRWRWRLLLAGWSSECVEALPFVIVVSCLLHNFLFKCGEVVPEEVLDLAVDERFPGFEGKGDEEGERVREALAAHLYSVSQKDELTVAAL